MKEGIHPKYGPATIRCACGNVIETRSTHQGTVQVDICSACHPFFTGRQKLMDTAGRIDRFTKKFGSKVVMGTQKKQKRSPIAETKPAKKEPPVKPGLKNLKDEKAAAETS